MDKHPTPMPERKMTLGDRLILNALRRKLDAWAAHEANRTKQTQDAFLAAVDHMNQVARNV